MLYAWLNIHFTYIYIYLYRYTDIGMPYVDISLQARFARNNLDVVIKELNSTKTCEGE